MSLYPSIEDMEKDQSARTEMTYQVARGLQVEAAARAGALTGPSPSASASASASTGPYAPSAPGGGSLYADLLPEEMVAYAGLDISPQALEHYMPHDEAMALAHQQVNAIVPAPSSAVALPGGAAAAALPGAHAIASITPKGDVGMVRSQVKQGLRQVQLAKDANGKLGMALKAIDKGLFVAFVWQGKAASLGGIRFGDQVVQINGQPVAGWTDAQACRFLRKADAAAVHFVVRDRPLCRTVTVIKDEYGYVGFTYNDGQIRNIVKDSSAARNGVLINHQIVEVGGRNVVGLKDKDILQIIKGEPQSVTFTIMPTFMFKHLVKNMGWDRLRKYNDHSVPEL